MMISKSPEPEPVQDWVMIIVMQSKYSSTLHPGPSPSIPALLSKPHFIVRWDSVAEGILAIALFQSPSIFNSH